MVFEGFRSRLTLLFLHLSSYVTEELYIKLRTYTLLKYILVFCLACALIIVVFQYYVFFSLVGYIFNVFLCISNNAKTSQKVWTVQQPFFTTTNGSTAILYNNHAKKKTMTYWHATKRNWKIVLQCPYRRYHTTYSWRWHRSILIGLRNELKET